MLKKSTMVFYGKLQGLRQTLRPHGVYDFILGLWNSYF